MRGPARVCAGCGNNLEAERRARRRQRQEELNRKGAKVRADNQDKLFSAIRDKVRPGTREPWRGAAGARAPSDWNRGSSASPPAISGEENMSVAICISNFSHSKANLGTLEMGAVTVQNAAKVLSALRLSLLTLARGRPIS